MSDWPNNLLPPPNIITPFSEESLGMQAILWTTSSCASNAWPTNNLALYFPFVLEMAATAYKMFTLNGTTASGNVDVGIYDDAFNAIVTKGATAQSGTSAIQEFDITDTELDPGTYWMALSFSSSAGTIFSNSNADELVVPQVSLYAQTSAHPLPTGTATPVKSPQATTPIPIFGVSFDTLI